MENRFQPIGNPAERISQLCDSEGTIRLLEDTLQALLEKRRFTPKQIHN